MEIHETADSDLDRFGLDHGEAEAIALAGQLHAGLLLMDERAGVAVALSKGLRVTGTLGILDMAAERGLLDFSLAMNRLVQTNFHRPIRIVEALLAKHQRLRQPK